MFLLALAFCPTPEFSWEAREQLQKEFADWILKSESVSSELKKQIEENEGEELRKVLYFYITKLDQNNREIIRKCRRKLFGKWEKCIKIGSKIDSIILSFPLVIEEIINKSLFKNF